MSFKLLTNILPLEIVKIIHEYHDTYKLSMNNVIKQIEQLNNAVDEYWKFDEMLYYMTEQEENNRLKLGLPITMDWPLPEKKCFRFWNTETIPTLEEVTHPRNNWWLYQYHDECYIYPTNMTEFFENKKLLN
tara:strand:+ start:1811 stop:2206 length:396 start_codon:yes stop_codon:yes gene_type:complete